MSMRKKDRKRENGQDWKKKYETKENDIRKVKGEVVSVFLYVFSFSAMYWTGKCNKFYQLECWGKKNTERSGSGPPWAICEQHKINTILTLLKIKMCEKQSSEQWSARKDCWIQITETLWDSPLVVQVPCINTLRDWLVFIDRVWKRLLSAIIYSLRQLDLGELTELVKTKKAELTATTKQFSAHLTHSFYPG